jgi:hypothetical protein
MKCPLLLCTNAKHKMWGNSHEKRRAANRSEDFTNNSLGVVSTSAEEKTARIRSCLEEARRSVLNPEELRVSPASASSDLNESGTSFSYDGSHVPYTSDGDAMSIVSRKCAYDFSISSRSSVNGSAFSAEPSSEFEDTPHQSATARNSFKAQCCGFR